MGSARINTKEREKKEGQVRRAKKSPGNWCADRGKRTEQKTEKEQKEKNREISGVIIWFIEKYKKKKKRKKRKIGNQKGYREK